MKVLVTGAAGFIGRAVTASLQGAGYDVTALDAMIPQAHGAATRPLAGELGEGHQLRIIEQMPLDAQGAWSRDDMVTAAETHQLLTERYDLSPSPRPRGSAPAEEFVVSRHGRELGTVGVIASVSEPFCGSCDRVRLTADGQVRDCLFARQESDLRSPMRAGATDEELALRWQRAVAGKLPGHGIDDPAFLQPARPMSAIGG